MIAFVIAVLGNLLGTALGGDGSWEIDGNQIFNGFVLGNVIGVLVGFALSTLIMNTAGAIVAYFAYTLILPIAVGILSALSEHVRGHRALDRVQHRADPAVRGRLHSRRVSSGRRSPRPASSGWSSRWCSGSGG